jgi:cob(I)alamin adenosyltransferase
MRIYTRSGDRGMTSLLSGERVRKDEARIEAYGDLDELNSVLGALAAAVRELGETSGSEAQRAAPGLVEGLERIQGDLLRAGGWLATSPGSPAIASLGEFPADRTAWLEALIDELEADLPTLTRFILPGGHPASAWAHLARCVCRRAERRVTHLAVPAEGGAAPAAPADPVVLQQQRILVYLNRLSDCLFVLARTCNRIASSADRVWEP